MFVYNIPSPHISDDVAESVCGEIILIGIVLRYIGHSQKNGGRYQFGLTGVGDRSACVKLPVFQLYITFEKVPRSVLQQVLICFSIGVTYPFYIVDESIPEEVP